MAELKVIFMDSGQGDSTLVVFPNNQIMLVDCGAVKNSKVVLNQLQQVLLRHINPNDTKQIERVVITHPDQDHYNMLVPVLGAVPNHAPQAIYYGGDIDQYQNNAKAEKNRTYDWLVAKDANELPEGHFGGAAPWFSAGGVDVYMLAVNATGDRQGDTNANSVVLMLHYKTFKIFLMGDATAETERFILNGCNQHAPNILDNKFATALKIGHHGSDTSSCEAWVKRLRPDALIISSDALHFGRNGKGLPPKSHLDNVVRWSGNVKNFVQGLNHRYVCWDDDPNSMDYKKFMEQGPTLQAICSTLYKIDYASNDVDFEATGGSWYWRIVDQTDKTELIVEWTGA